MILSFRCRDTERLFLTRRTKVFTGIASVAYQKLVMLHVAQTLADLVASPGNRLEKLIGDRKGQYSIRLNDKFRICFVWENGGASAVEICDYHA